MYETAPLIVPLVNALVSLMGEETILKDTTHVEHPIKQPLNSKKTLTARKKQIKNLKSKDEKKKIEALKYCVQDELFIREPEVVSLVMSFLSRYKVV